MKLEGRDGGGLLGGVWDLVPLWVCVECAEPGKLASGDIVCGVACGMVFSKSSALNTRENLSFASSARYN